MKHKPTGCLGKNVSCGVIALYCQNLPPDLRYRPENVFIIAITPAPTGPDALNVHHLLDPIVDQFIPYGGAQGILHPTFHNPIGEAIRARIAPVLADAPARVLISGFLGHGATFFCPFCLCTSDDIDRLDLGNWTIRSGVKVRAQAKKWKEKITLSDKKTRERKNGVRWTSLHDLPYWDPVKHVVLGYMHNWLEGILQDHLRILWGIGRDEAHQKTAQNVEAELREDSERENWLKSDVSDSASELEGLRREAFEYESQKSGSSTDLRSQTEDSHPTPPPNSPPPGTTEDISVDASSESTARPPRHWQSVDENDSGDDEGYVEIPEDVFKLHPDFHRRMKLCIRDITLPTWVGRPPANLGEASHGKLRAYDYLVLFSFIFPLIMPEFWYFPEASDLDKLHMANFHQLVVTTNIICSYQTTNEDADEFTDLYVKYRRGIQTLFPYWPSKPNHHYAMHYAEFLKFYGPLPPLSEFPGERLIGILQKINTNKRLRK